MLIVKNRIHNKIKIIKGIGWWGMNRTILSLIRNNFKCTILIGVFTGILLYLVFGKKIFLSFDIGFVLGCFNFVTLAYGVNSMMNLSPGRAKNAHFFTFVIRYTFIAFVFILMIRYKNANIYALALGLISINTSIKIRALVK